MGSMLIIGMRNLGDQYFLREMQEIFSIWQCSFGKSAGKTSPNIEVLTLNSITDYLKYVIRAKRNMRLEI
jgi:hypothetical protein